MIHYNKLVLGSFMISYPRYIINLEGSSFRRSYNSCVEVEKIFLEKSGPKSLWSGMVCHFYLILHLLYVRLSLMPRDTPHPLKLLLLFYFFLFFPSHDESLSHWAGLKKYHAIKKFKIFSICHVNYLGNKSFTPHYRLQILLIWVHILDWINRLRMSGITKIFYIFFVWVELLPQKEAIEGVTK